METTTLFRVKWLGGTSIGQTGSGALQERFAANILYCTGVPNSMTNSCTGLGTPTAMHILGKLVGKPWRNHSGCVPEVVAYWFWARLEGKPDSKEALGRSLK